MKRKGLPWFRFYANTIDDVKQSKLSDRVHRIWVGLLCLTSEHGGMLPPLDVLAYRLRKSEKEISEALQKLIDVGLMEHVTDGIKPHNWDELQYKSDNSTERAAASRQRKRNAASNVASTFDATAPERDTESESESEAEREGEETASAAPRAPIARNGKTGWPSDFALTPRHINFAKNTGGFDLSHTQTMFEGFARYHKSEGTQSADWDINWERWVHQEIKFNGKPGQEHNSFL
jgi:hypothetical protein